MRASVRNCLLIVSLLTSSAPSRAADGIYLPPAPTGPGGEDSVETASGTRCRQSINGNNGYMDIGASVSRSGGPRDPYNLYGGGSGGGGSSSDQALGYARVTIPLGRKPARIDCTRLYEMEIERMKQEIELLKMAAQ